MKLDDSSQLAGSKAFRIFFITLAVALTCLLLPACSRNDPLPDDVIQAFEIAFTKHDIEGCLALFADDAQILPEHGSVIAGRENIKDFLHNSMTPVVSFNTYTDMQLVRGDIAVEQGHFTVRNIRRGANIELGKYMHIRRKIDGDWKLYRLIYNTDVAPKGEATVEGTPETTG